MSASLARPDLRFLHEGMQRLVRWWFGELAALLPFGVRHDIADLPVLRIEREALATPEALAARIAGGKPEAGRQQGVHLVFAADLALARRERLPAAVGKRLREAAALQVERGFPLLPEHLLWAVSDLGLTDTGHREIEIHAVRRADVAPIEAGLSVAGIPVALRSIERTDGTLLPLDAPSSGLFGRRRLPAMLLAGAALLLLAAAAVWLGRTAIGAAALERELTRSEAAMADLLELRDALDRRRQRHDVLAAALGRPQAGEAMDELARLLPDEVWIREFALDGAGLALAGIAPDPAALVLPLEASPMFEEVELDSVDAAPQEAGQGFRLRMRLTAHGQGAPR